MYVEDCFNVKIGGGVGLARGQGNPYVEAQCILYNVYRRASMSQSFDNLI